jgi:hypothetical protein
MVAASLLTFHRYLQENYSNGSRLVDLLPGEFLGDD